MDVNAGAGFENKDPNDNPTCPSFVAIFGESAALSKQLLDAERSRAPRRRRTPDPAWTLLYSTYRPATWPEGKIPVLSWGNGTCAQPEGYGALLRYIASQGFFIVAANNREVGK